MNGITRLLVGITSVTAFATIAGCGSGESGDSGGEARDVAIEAVEYAFSSNEAITIEAGDTIRFQVTNAGQLLHELEVLTDASRRLGKTEEIPPGEQRDVTVTFDEPGVYTVICDIDDHRTRGQEAQFEVTEKVAETTDAGS